MENHSGNSLEHKTEFPTLIRLRLVRLLANCATRKDFSIASGIPLATLEAWERSMNHLTAKGAQRLSRALIKLGVVCQEEWLRFGAGSFPSRLDDHEYFHLPIFGLPSHIQLPSDVLFEAQAFLKSQPLGVLAFIGDDGMIPIYRPGDLVGGIRFKINELEKIIYSNAILEKKDGEVKVRRILPGIRPGLISATCLNLDTRDVQLTEYNLDLKSCAQIVWHRHIFKAF
jgi:hypothetical protein